ncbi:hypothetical protein [Actinokineospora diospyrosa]|uniref:DisA checkpoint controller-like protein n=1 Tax=Actinokineospora diospyrosa TaxID=103728 RepID=A0ABT1IDG8_9PSEU|nr:hypothetical protein [Actinokineospora diospyrosa]MCP2270669.1 hypothetical protein [Actinokineospora diospyrosa]
MSQDDLDDWALELAQAIVKQKTDQFSGIGLILYSPPLRLPTVRMVENELVSISVRDSTESAELLTPLADKSSPFHDGFHLIRADCLELTHICQFVSPPIPEGVTSIITGTAVGARNMSALLTSLAPSIELAVAISQSGRIVVYKEGRIRFDTATPGAARRLP